MEVLPARILLSDGLKGFTGLCANAQIVPSSFESAGTPVIFSTSSASGGASGGAASASSSEFVAVERRARFVGPQIRADHDALFSG
jgi:hypothetical protein